MSAIRKDEHERAPAGARRRRTDEDNDNDYGEYDENNDDDDRDYDDEDYEEDQENGENEENERDERRSPGGGLSASEAGDAGMRHITAIVTKDVEGITAVRPADDGWTVEIELLEARHIPSSSDTLSLYEIDIDSSGELKSYRRTAMYSRARGREMR
ncbi:MAG TPA: gas vesicle protein GvpO [Streptosporangiaceae bacterium]|nr:gas vesicle protein GvpO [Streptosporangiaceae bacterium]